MSGSSAIDGCGSATTDMKGLIGVLTQVLPNLGQVDVTKAMSIYLSHVQHMEAIRLNQEILIKKAEEQTKKYLAEVELDKNRTPEQRERKILLSYATYYSEKIPFWKYQKCAWLISKNMSEATAAEILSQAGIVNTKEGIKKLQAFLNTSPCTPDATSRMNQLVSELAQDMSLKAKL